MASGRPKRSHSGRRANGTVKLGDVKNSVTASKKPNKPARKTADKNLKRKGGNNSKRVRGTRSRVAVAAVLWTVIILAALLYLAYKLTVKPPIITPVPTPTTSHNIDDPQKPEDDNTTQNPQNLYLRKMTPAIVRKDNFYTFLVIERIRLGRIQMY